MFNAPPPARCCFPWVKMLRLDDEMGGTGSLSGWGGVEMPSALCQLPALPSFCSSQISLHEQILARKDLGVSLIARRLFRVCPAGRGKRCLSLLSLVFL